jgi:hypothetical protein
VSTRREKSCDINFRLGFIEAYQRRRPVLAHPPTQNSYRWNSTPLILFDGGPGRQDLNLQLPNPEACALPYLYEYKANKHQKYTRGWAVGWVVLVFSAPLGATAWCRTSMMNCGSRHGRVEKPLDKILGYCVEHP